MPLTRTLLPLLITFICSIGLLQAQTFQVAEISFEGNKKTKDFIVEREVVLKKDSTYSPELFSNYLWRSKENLMNTTLFVDVLFDTTLVGEGQYKVHFLLKERWYIFPTPYFTVADRNWNVWINEHNASLSRTNVGVKLRHENVTGRNDKFNLWLIGGYTRQVSFNYLRPFVDKRLRFGYKVSFKHIASNEINFATDANKQLFYSANHKSRELYSADAALTYNKNSRLRMQLYGRYNFEKIADTIAKLNPGYFGNATIKATYFDFIWSTQYYKVDYIPYPLRGWFLTTQLQQRLSENSALNMTKIQAELFAVKQIGKNNYLDLYIYGVHKFQNNLPFANAQLFGYTNKYIQGLEYFVLDGNSGFLSRLTFKKNIFNWYIKSLFKDKKTENPGRLRKTFNELSKTHNDIPFRVFLKVYGNVGYIDTRYSNNNYMSNQWLRTAGIGIDILTAYDFVFRFDLSFNQFERGGIGNLPNKFFYHINENY